MQSYDPMIAPDPRQWHSLDEYERVALVVKYHQQAGIELPDENAHALTTMIEKVTCVTDDEKIIEISKILTEWNPLGERAAAMNDLNNYQTEAVDILSTIELCGHSPKKAASAVLQEAFMIDLEKTELDHYSRKIQAILAKQ